MARSGKVQVLIGTRKGGYIAESDRARKKWKISAPIEAGADVFHMKADPRNPGTIYTLANHGFWGPMVLRSKDSGKSWKEISTPLMPRKSKRPNPFATAGEVKHPIKNLWHLEPGPEGERKTLFLGVDPASLYRSDDLGDSWEPVPGINEHATRSKWNPGFGGLCLHTILIDPANPRRMYIGISAAGTFRTEDGGEHWKPVNKGVKVSFQPEKYPEFGQCVHKVAMDPANPSTFYRQDHDGIYVSHDRMDSWQRVGNKLDHDFGFVVAAPQAAPGKAYFFPLHGWSRVTKEGGPQVWEWNDAPKKWRATMKPSKFPGEYGAHREGFAADTLDPFGLYLGTTTGNVFFTADGAKSWSQIPYQFPSIHSVSVASPSD
jgi:photosystem II stability/assembly factor-like uncharacterized protein